MPHDLLIKNIKGLAQVREEAPGKQTGAALGELPVIENAWLAVNDDRITAFGPMDTCPQNVDEQNIIDASGKFVLPAWCDSHSHIVYAGTREGEFVDRIKGVGYEEIARKGGGILNSAKRLCETPEDEIYEQSLARAHEIMRTGTGAVEIKSGYALALEGELKMLRVAKRIAETTPLTVKTTFLGAHAVPAKYKDDRAGYLKLVTEEMIPAVAEQGLADYCDVFCETGFFTPEETDQVLQAGAKHGLKGKVHANQLNNSGGIQAGARNNALSVDHLEHCGPAEIEALQNSDTIPTLLPTAAFFLSLDYPPARKMIEAGLPVALSTDYNPGSTPSGNMPFVLSLACIKMRMTPEEAINAATINSAFAMEVDRELGSITPGKRANLIVSKPMESLAFIPYAFGSDHIDQVILNGKSV